MIAMQPDEGRTAQVTLGSNSVQIISPNKNRQGVLLTNLSNNDVYFGFNRTVTNQTGSLLVGSKGAWLFIETFSALWGVGNGAVSVLELL